VGGRLYSVMKKAEVSGAKSEHKDRNNNRYINK
jgi:hypothetical protein